jgi:hypothetical protein
VPESLRIDLSYAQLQNFREVISKNFKENKMPNQEMS